MTIELALLPGVTCRGQEITGPRLRGLLALLAGDLHTGCSTARLVDELWPDEQPANPTKALQVLVSRLRAQVGSDLIVSTPTGYRLGLDTEQVDTSAAVLHAATSAKRARADDPATALAEAEAGLALWPGADGEAGSGGSAPSRYDPVADLRAERAATHRTLVRLRAIALSQLGRHAEAVEVLRTLAVQHPRDEELLLELVRSEAATAGPSEALARYDAYRRRLRDELGTDPGSALQALYEELLRGEGPTIRQGIPYEPNSLLGRAGDIAAVTNLIRTSRVTSIVGPGGLGKTRLAYVVSREADQRIVHLVPLAGVTADDDVMGEVAAALGVGEAWRAGHPAPQNSLLGMVETLGAGPTLLVLDNCEQVVRGVAELVSTLVSMIQDLRVLTTSRTPLGISSESVYLLPELNLTTSVELFRQRATAARPGADLPARAVEELCAHLDGLPLAVELAAARVRVLSVTEIAQRLEDRFSLLRGAARDTPERHQTLRAVVDWSWNLLDPPSRAAMSALSIFPAGFTSTAAEHVVNAVGAVGADGPLDVLSVLESLVDQSLLKVEDTPVGTRFRMLETVREFSTAQREASGETEQIVDGLLGWAREFGLAYHESPFGPDPFRSVALVRAEQENLAQALRYALARADPGSIVPPAAVLSTLWIAESNYIRLHVLGDQADWLLSHYRPEPDLVEVTRTTLVSIAAYAFVIQGPRAVRSVVSLRRLPPAKPTTLIRALAVVLTTLPGDLDELHALCDSDEPLVACVANAFASYASETAGDLDRALESAARMLTAFDHYDVPWMRVLAHSRLAELYLQVERGDEARHHLLIALPVMENLGAMNDAAGIRWWMVLANLQTGAIDEAERWLDSAAPTLADESVTVMGYDLGVRAELLLARGSVEAGLRMWRRLVDRLTDPNDLARNFAQYGLDPWVTEAQAVSVVAHAGHREAGLVEKTVDELAHRVSWMLAHPLVNPPPYIMEFPLMGTMLLALGMVELADGSAAALEKGSRLVALADRFGFLRNFQPTMSGVRVRQVAAETGGTAYDEAVSSYAALDRDGLRAAARSVLGVKPPSASAASAPQSSPPSA